MREGTSSNPIIWRGSVVLLYTIVCKYLYINVSISYTHPYIKVPYIMAIYYIACYPIAIILMAIYEGVIWAIAILYYVCIY